MNSKKLFVALACAIILPSLAFAKAPLLPQPAPPVAPAVAQTVPTTSPAFMKNVKTSADFAKLMPAQKQVAEAFFNAHVMSVTQRLALEQQARRDGPITNRPVASGWMLNVKNIVIAVAALLVFLAIYFFLRWKKLKDMSVPIKAFLFLLVLTSGIFALSPHADATFNNNCGTPIPGACGSPYADGVHVTGTVQYQGRSASVWTNPSQVPITVPPGASIDVLTSMSFDNQNPAVNDQVSASVIMGSGQCLSRDCGWGGFVTPASIPGTSSVAIAQWKTLNGGQSVNADTVVTAPAAPGIYGVVWQFCDAKYGAGHGGPGMLNCYTYPDTIQVVAPTPTGVCGSANGTSPAPNIDPSTSAFEAPGTFSSNFYGTNYPNVTSSLCSTGSFNWGDFHGYQTWDADGYWPFVSDTSPGTYDEFYAWTWTCGGSGMTTVSCASKGGEQIWTTVAPPPPPPTPTVHIQFQ